MAQRLMSLLFRIFLSKKICRHKLNQKEEIIWSTVDPLNFKLWTESFKSI